MDDLLKALRDGDRARINEYAKQLLVTRDNRLNKLQAQEFERYAPCRVIEWRSTTFKSRPYVGTIIYGNYEYGFG